MLNMSVTGLCQVVKNFAQQFFYNVIHPLVKTLGVLGDAIRPSRCRCRTQHDDERPMISTRKPGVGGYDNAFRGNSQMIDAE